MKAGLGGDVQSGFDSLCPLVPKAQAIDESRLVDAQSLGRLEKDSRSRREVVTMGVREEP